MAQLIQVVGVGLAACAWLLAAALLWRTAVPDGLELPPVDVESVFGARAAEEAADYRRVLRALWAGLAVAQLAALYLLVRAAPRLERRLRGPSLLRGIQLGLVSVALLWAVWLPFAAVGLWWRRKHDIARLGYGDLLFEPWPRYLGEALVTAGAVGVAMLLARRLGRRWWLVGGPAFVALVGTVLVLTPLVLSPRLAPLEDRRLAGEIERLAERTGRGKETAINVASRDYWPFPWYFRDYKGVGYHGSVAASYDPQSTPIVVGREDSQPADADYIGKLRPLLKAEYEEVGTYDLRPGVRLVLFARRDLVRG
jgi:hypothetical protein